MSLRPWLRFLAVVAVSAPGYAQAPRQWTASIVAEIGGAAGRGPTEFQHVVDAVQLRDGRIVVADDAALEVRLFLPSGAFAGTLLRKGRGPREMSQLHRLFYEGDTLFATEAFVAVHQISLLSDAALRYVLAPVDGYLRGVAVGSVNGSDLVFRLKRVTRDAGPNRMPDVMPESVFFGRLPVAGGRVEIVARMEEEQQFALGAGRPGTYPLAFAAGPLFVARGGRVCTARSSTFVVECRILATDQRYVVRREVPVRRVDRQSREAWVAAAAGVTYGDTARWGGSLREHRRRVADNTPFATTFPVISQLRLTEDGELWVRAFDVEDALRPTELRTNRRPSHWAIFDMRGLLIAECVLPARFAPTQINRGTVVGVSRDDDDVERVIVLSIDRSDRVFRR